MNRRDGFRLSRRSFVGSVCPLVVSNLAFSRFGLRAQHQEPRGFWDELTPEEQQAIDASLIAQDVENHIGQGPERVIFARRFAGKGIQAGAGDGMVLQSFRQRSLIHDSAPGRIDQIGGGLHPLELFAADEVPGFRGLGTVQGHNIRLFEQGFEPVYLSELRKIGIG